MMLTFTVGLATGFAVGVLIGYLMALPLIRSYQRWTDDLIERKEDWYNQYVIVRDKLFEIADKEATE